MSRNASSGLFWVGLQLQKIFHDGDFVLFYQEASTKYQAGFLGPTRVMGVTDSTLIFLHSLNVIASNVQRTLLHTAVSDRPVLFILPAVLGLSPKTDLTQLLPMDLEAVIYTEDGSATSGMDSSLDSLMESPLCEWTSSFGLPLPEVLGDSV